MSSNTTVFLIDDDKSVRDGLKWLIESVDLKVEVYESAIAFLEANDGSRPGCLVLDVRMPGMSGLDLQEELVNRKILLPIIIITGHGDVPMCVRAFQWGAFAFLEKPINHQLLLDHVQKAIESDSKMRDRLATSPNIDDHLERLTQREREVMDLLLVGKTMKKIAAELAISIQTCSKHRAKVFDKLEVDNDVELVRIVLGGQSIA